MDPRNRASWIVLLGLLIAAIPASGAVITFDEFVADNGNGPMPPNRYAFLGVTWNTTDDGSTWGGITNGDPGNWDLDGTNGPIFSGYNGGSYGATLTFDSMISNFSLDVSRSLGSSRTDTYTLEGWSNNVMIESITIGLDAINQWSTVSLLNDVDEVRWFGTGNGFHPFGIDNIVWNEERVPEPATTGIFALGLLALGVARRRVTSGKSVDPLR